MFLPEFAAAVLACTLPADALEPAVGHVELDANHKAGTWEWRTYWYDNDLNERTDPVETLYFPGNDSPPASLGIRNIRPADPKWNFLGMNAGEPVWIFTGTSYVSAGFAATQDDLSGTMDFALESVAGPAGGFFSMYEGSATVVHMSTLDGIGSTDLFQKPDHHSHVNWAFSKKGLWIVNLKVSGTLASSGTPTAWSSAQPIVFAIGDLAQWQAARFTATELMDPGVSGNDADPDGDGYGNLMEYALGGDCRSASMVREDDGQPLAPRLLPPASPGQPWHFQYFRRIAGRGVDVEYSVESSSLAGEWTEETGSEEIPDADDDWEEVSVPVAAGDKRFFRLKVVTIP